MTRHTLASLILLAALPLAATAAEPTAGSKAGTPPMFSELDTNHDGQVSQSEAKRSADISARFSALDVDKNKQISLSEWQADEKARGAAGVSGESRDPSTLKEHHSTTPETPKSGSGGY